MARQRDQLQTTVVQQGVGADDERGGSISRHGLPHNSATGIFLCEQFAGALVDRPPFAPNP